MKKPARERQMLRKRKRARRRKSRPRGRRNRGERSDGDDLTFERRIDELVAAPFRTTPPGVLYHYTRRDAFAQIVKSQEFWARAHYSMDDERELDSAGRHIWDVADSLIARSTGETRSILEMFMKHYGNYKISRKFDGFLVCFSAARDKESQWLRYGAAGTGVCIGVKVLDESGDLGDPPGMGRQLFGVDYDSESWVRRVESAFGEICAVLGEAERTGRRGTIRAASGQVLSGLFRVAAFAETIAKRSPFASEEEWRLVAVAQKGWPTKKFPDPPGGDYVPLPLRGKGMLMALDEIIIGPRWAPEDTDPAAWVEETLMAAGYPDESAQMPRISSSTCAMS